MTRITKEIPMSILQGEKLNVLIIDDEENFLKQVKNYLESNYDFLNIETATSAEEGLSIFESSDFDAIVSDYRLPEMDGIDLLKSLRKDGHDEPFIIILTGKGREETAVKALNYGVSNYLRKRGSAREQFESLADTIIQEVEKWRKEKESERIRERYMRIFDGFGDGVAVLKLGNEGHGKILDCNPSFSEQTGYSEDELVGKKIQDLTVEEEENPEIEAKREDLARGEDVIFTEKMVKKDGALYWTEVVATPIEYDEKEAILAIYRDVTERKKRKEKLEEAYRAIETAQEAFLGVEESGEIFFCNEGATQLFGYTRDELLSMPIVKLVPEEYRDIHKKSLERFLRRDKESPKTFLEVEGLRKDGTRFPIEWALSSYEGGDGRMKIMGAGRDITKRKKREVERLQREIAQGTSENITGDIIREFGVEITAGELGLPDLLEHLSKLSTTPPPESTIDLMIVGTKRTLKDKGVEASAEKIREVIAPTLWRFLKEVISIAEEHYLEVPEKYEEIKEEIKPGH